jgi:transcriptional regulator with XRE-family HTH domain
MARTYLKEWRKHRGLTQDQVVDRLAAFDDEKIPRTAASLSRIENGQQIYTQRILEALADVYSVDEPGWLLDRNPLVAGEVIDMWAKLTERDRAQARVIIEALSKTGTEE